MSGATEPPCRTSSRGIANTAWVLSDAPLVT